MRKELGLSGRDFCFPLEGMLFVVVLIKKDKGWHAQSLSFLFFFFFPAVTSRAAVYNCVIGCLDTFSKLFSKC